MSESPPSREDAWELLCEHTRKEGRRRHALAVEAAMREYARHLGEDEELWGLTGLLHDFGGERWPDPGDHPSRGVEVLAEHGYPEELRAAILARAPYTGVPRESRLARALYAVAELARFVVAVALATPDRSLAEVDRRSVERRFGDATFGAGIHREEVRAGAAELGVDLGEHVERVLAGLRRVADALGL